MSVFHLTVYHAAFLVTFCKYSQFQLIFLRNEVFLTVYQSFLCVRMDCAFWVMK